MLIWTCTAKTHKTSSYYCRCFKCFPSSRDLCKAFTFTHWSAWKIEILPTIKIFSFTVHQLWECLICKCFASWFFKNKDRTTGAHTYVCISDVLEVINYKYTYEVMESGKYECMVLMNYFSLYSFYTSTYIADIICISLGRCGCVENTDQKRC